MASSSSASTSSASTSSQTGCEYVVKVTIPNVTMTCRVLNADGEGRMFEDSLIDVKRPLIIGTVLQKKEDGNYYPLEKLIFKETFNSIGIIERFELKYVEIPEDTLSILKPIDSEKYGAEIFAVTEKINTIYKFIHTGGKVTNETILTRLDSEGVKKLNSEINAIIFKWEAAKPSSCVIAGGRRRPKKSRRSRSSRKRRQTRSK